MFSPSPEASLWPRFRRTAVPLGLALLTACGPGAGEISEARALYSAELDGFSVRQEPIPGIDPPRLEQDVTLALTVRREAASGEAPGGLPGITLDVDQVDAAGKSRRHWRVWIETAGLEPGRELRVEPVLEEIDYTPGDGFRVEVRRSIPGAERAGYREYGNEPGAPATSGGPAS